MRLRTSIRTPMLGVLLLLAPASHATLILAVSEENVTGGGGPLSGSSTDENFLSVDLTNGFGSASLAALRSLNDDTSNRNTDYINRSRWELSNVFFSADTPGTTSATVVMGGRLTAALSASVSSGGFNGSATTSVRVLHSFTYLDPVTNLTVSGGTDSATSLFDRRLLVGGFTGLLADSADVDEFVGAVLTLPVDVPITLSMTLETAASMSGPSVSGRALADAANTLQFDTANFFDITTPGVTANAGTFLVDNRVAGSTTLPLPSSVALLAGGVLLLAVRRRGLQATAP